MRSLLPICLPLVLATTACSEPPPDAVAWQDEDPRPDIAALAAWDLPELSLYAMHRVGDAGALPRERGTFGVGNGRAFAFLGLADPVNTLHGAAGPTYSREARFFRDVGFTLRVDGQDLPFEEQWIARPRGTGLVVTRADAGAWSLYTLDYAPRGTSSPPWLVRRVVVTGGTGQVALAHTGAPGWRWLDGQWVDLAGQRVLIEVPLHGALTEDGSAWALGEATGAPLFADVVWVASNADADLAAQAQAARAADLDTLLVDTLAAWRAESARGVQLSAPDPRWADLYDSLRVGISVQTTEGGGVSPMSRYSLVWLRDTVGPVRFLSRAGLFDEAWRALDYLHLCHVARGDFGNACASDLTHEDAGPEPDWASLPPLSGKTAAEGPSYVPLAYDVAARWSGDTSRLQARWAYLSRALLAQQRDAAGRQPWSGDETFRLVMGVALGYPLEYDLQGLAWSANSSWLLAAASTAMADRAQELGEDPAPFEATTAAAHTALEGTFLQPDGHYAALAFHSAGDHNEVGVDPRPYEDANLKALWLGVLTPDQGLADFEALYAQAGHGDGTLVTPPARPVDGVLGLEVQEGAYTGMLPGYTLWAFTALGLPEAELAFAALHRSADEGGQLSEDHLRDDETALQVVYDPSGVLGDIAARYRPWEGAIVGDALLYYLIGAEPTEDGLRLSPHLPHGQPWLEARSIRVRDQQVDLRLDRDRRGLTATVTATTAARVTVSLPVDPDSHADGIVQLPGGEARLWFDPIDLAAGESVTLRAR